MFNYNSTQGQQGGGILGDNNNNNNNESSLPDDAPYMALSADPDDEYSPEAQERKQQNLIRSYRDQDHKDNTSHDSDNNNSDDDDDDSDLLEPFPDFANRRNGSSRNDHNNNEDIDDDVLRPGDHIYVLVKRKIGVGTYQKHGLVYNVDKTNPMDTTIVSFYHERGEQDKEECGDYEYEKDGNNHLDTSWNDNAIINGLDNNDNVDNYSFRDCYNVNAQSNSSLLMKDNPAHDNDTGNFNSNSASFSSSTTPNVKSESLSIFCLGTNGEVHKVKYGQTIAKRLLSRPGTVTSCKADEDGLIIARMTFLLNNPHTLPPYHRFQNNDECVAVWCRIGRWCTLQGSSILQIMFAGQAGGAAAGGVIASNVCFWTPMPGFWGSMGYIWYVPATVAYPILVPILLGFGLASLLPLEVLRRYRKKWAETTNHMNTDFWLKTDDYIKELYFAASVSTDDNWMKKFFMNDEEQKKEEERGQYMPLGSNGIYEDDGHDDDDDDDNNNHKDNLNTKQTSAEYGIHSFQTPSNNEQSFGRNLKGMLGKMNSSFRNKMGSSGSSKTMSISDFDDRSGSIDASQPLSSSSSNYESEPGNLGRRWSASWKK